MIDEARLWIRGVRPWIRSHPRGVDATLAVVLCAITLASTTMERPPHIHQWPPLPAVIVALASSGALLTHRRHPRLTVIATTAGGAALGAMAPSLGYQFGSTLVGTTMAALASLAWRTDQRTTGRYTAAAALTLLAASVIWAPDGTLLQPEQVGLVGFVLLAAAVADSTRSRRDYVAAVEARAELAERTREDEARHRVGAERMRIARELHDVVAHHITLAHAQAATADYLLSTKPDQARDAMRHLTPTLVSALNELRATVGLLRQTGRHETPLDPAPGLDRLPGLLADFKQAGLAVHLTRDGTPRPLSPGVDLTAYRIVQEALTNVTKHARTGSACLQLAYAESLLTITISDNGPHDMAADTSTGYGLIGMRERVQAAGGRLRARPKDGSGFEVVAELSTDPPHEERL
ncbi:sensor histidine kinase [Streptomyces boninensis]|uniref:sensor histidine kinase n=1 Tax=Streptomyces boninensis TaxID=2039455 RepID=UPI003B20BDE2